MSQPAALLGRKATTGSPIARRTRPAFNSQNVAQSNRSLPRGFSIEYFGNIQYTTPKNVTRLRAAYSLFRQFAA